MDPASADSESSPTSNPGWKRGIRVGNAITGHVLYFIPDPAPEPRGVGDVPNQGVDDRESDSADSPDVADSSAQVHGPAKGCRKRGSESSSGESSADI